MQVALKGVPVQEYEPPEGVVRTKSDWAFDEFGSGRGVSSLGLEDKVPKPPSTEERSSILDLFKR